MAKEKVRKSPPRKGPMAQQGGAPKGYRMRFLGHVRPKVVNRTNPNLKANPWG